MGAVIWQTTLCIVKLQQIVPVTIQQLKRAIPALSCPVARPSQKSENSGQELRSASSVQLFSLSCRYGFHKCGVGEQLRTMSVYYVDSLGRPLP